MSYRRVIPRDLFNEAKLLKCMGQLSLLIHDGPKWGLTLTHDDTESPGFLILQNQSDGSLYCTNLELECGGRLIGLRSPYNNKDAFPLLFCLEDEEGRVFDDAGAFSEHFKALLLSLSRGKKSKSNQR